MVLYIDRPYVLSNVEKKYSESKEKYDEYLAKWNYEAEVAFNVRALQL